MRPAGQLEKNRIRERRVTIWSDHRDPRGSYTRGDWDGVVVGRLYENGQVVVKDYIKAREWFQKAAEAGNPEATYTLNNISESAQNASFPFLLLNEQ